MFQSLKRLLAAPLTLCVLMGVVGGLPAQKPQDQGIPVIKMTTRLIQVNVVVHSKDGRPVEDLTKEDFVLLDKGVEQKIRYLSVTKAGTPANQPAAPQAGTYSNRYTKSAVTGEMEAVALPNSITVILLDGLNTKLFQQEAVKQALIKFLGNLQRGDRVAIYTLGRELRVLHSFTSDTQSLLRVLTRKKNDPSSPESHSSFEDENTNVDALDQLSDRANQMVADFAQQERTRATLEALEAIANHLAGMPGRKNLIWLSGGFPIATGVNADGSKIGRAHV